METCNECGLPKPVCDAVSLYRQAFEASEAGNAVEAHRCAAEAADLLKKYRAQRPQLQPINLTDEERIRLSAF